MKEFNTRVWGEKIYRINFATDNKEEFDMVQTICRLIIDGKSGEAIPKEWIINWLNKQTIPAFHTCDNYEAVNMMLEDWEKENEK